MPRPARVRSRLASSKLRKNLQDDQAKIRLVAMKLRLFQGCKVHMMSSKEARFHLPAKSRGWPKSTQNWVDTHPFRRSAQGNLCQRKIQKMYWDRSSSSKIWWMSVEWLWTQIPITSSMRLSFLSSRLKQARTSCQRSASVTTSTHHIYSSIRVFEPSRITRKQTLKNLPDLAE